MVRTLAILTMSSLLGGCGLGATGAAGAAGGTSEVQQAAQAKHTEEQVRDQVNAAQEEAARRGSEAEQQNQ
jgi:hypothetical protein